MRKRDIIAMYSSGLLELALAALGCSVIGLIAMQLLASLIGTEVDASGALLFIWQIIVFMSLWPGQRFWTIRRMAPSGYVHSIVGTPSDDDLRVENRRTAQRIRQQVRD